MIVDFSQSREAHFVYLFRFEQLIVQFRQIFALFEDIDAIQ
jgi:hypothetical protein